MKSLQRDVASLEVARAETFEPPPRGWIADRVGDLQQVLEQRTEKSGLILRRLLGDVTLTPQTPEVGRPYLQARCSFEVLNLIEDRELNPETDRGSNLLQWWTRLQPIRTAAEVPVEFAVFTHEPFIYQRIGAEVRRMRGLGMTLHAIANAFGVDEKTVKNVLRMSSLGFTY